MGDNPYKSKDFHIVVAKSDRYLPGQNSIDVGAGDIEEKSIRNNEGEKLL